MLSIEQAHWEQDGSLRSAEEGRDRKTFRGIDDTLGNTTLKAGTKRESCHFCAKYKTLPHIFLMFDSTRSGFHFCDQCVTGEEYSSNTQGLRDFLFASFLITVSHRGPEDIRPVTQVFTACSGSIFCNNTFSGFCVAEKERLTLAKEQPQWVLRCGGV